MVGVGIDLRRYFIAALLLAAALSWRGGSPGALPQFAAARGSRCIACHVNSQGGGLRTYRGWSEYRSKSIVRPESIGAEKIFSPLEKTNTFLDHRLIVGGDFRFQTIRSHKSGDANRRYFPMQAAVSASYRLHELFLVEATYNFGPRKFPGQEKASASLIMQPRYSTTQLRLGYFRPSIGVNYDDHTMLVRTVGGAGGLTLVPVNYAELGAEITYDVGSWIKLTTGVFGAVNMAENKVFESPGKQVSLIEDDGAPSFLGRFEVRHAELLQGVFASSGMSVLMNGDFTLANIFSGIGLWENVSILLEYAHSVKEDLRTTKNAALDLTCSLKDGAFLLFLRGERGVTNETFGGFDIETYTNQGVAGIQLFVLPHVELRPEYRIMDTEQYSSTRYAVQLHLFY